MPILQLRRLSFPADSLHEVISKVSTFSSSHRDFAFLFRVTLECDVGVSSMVVHTTDNDLTSDVLFDILNKLSTNCNCNRDFDEKGILAPDRL
jgi:hypothetical protein